VCGHSVTVTYVCYASQRNFSVVCAVTVVIPASHSGLEMFRFLLPKYPKASL